MLTQVMFLRTLLMMLPCGGCGRVALRSDGKENGFLMSLLRLGGIEKAYTLLVVARFDRDQNDIIDDEERREYEKQGERLVTNAIAGCQNTAVVAALLVAAAHLTSIGRPIAFSASPDFMELYGQPAADVVLSLTYFFNVLVEVGALLLLGYCTFGRVLLVYVLPSLGARLTYLVESNLPGMISHYTLLLISFTICVVGLGGILAHPRMGVIAAVGGPLFAWPLVFHCSYYWFQATLVLHRQVRSIYEVRSDARVREMARAYLESEASTAGDDAAGGGGGGDGGQATGGVLGWAQEVVQTAVGTSSEAGGGSGGGHATAAASSSAATDAPRDWKHVSMKIYAGQAFSLGRASGGSVERTTSSSASGGEPGGGTSLVTA